MSYNNHRRTWNDFNFYTVVVVHDATNDLDLRKNNQKKKKVMIEVNDNHSEKEIMIYSVL